MITFKTGDIWTTEMCTIVIPVNCVGVMGAGLAKQFADRFPDEVIIYKHFLKDGYLSPGQPTISYTKPKNFILFATKYHWRNESKIGWIDNGIVQIDKFPNFGLESIAFPALGCGCGGLDWAKVKDIMVSRLSSFSIPIEIYEPR